MRPHDRAGVMSTTVSGGGSAFSAKRTVAAIRSAPVSALAARTSNGVAYDRFATHVDLSKGGFDGRLNFGYQGALIYLRGGF
jgi:hypothetical protein